MFLTVSGGEKLHGLRAGWSETPAFGLIHVQTSVRAEIILLQIKEQIQTLISSRNR